MESNTQNFSANLIRSWSISSTLPSLVSLRETNCPYTSTYLRSFGDLLCKIHFSNKPTCLPEPCDFTISSMNDARIFFNLSALCGISRGSNQRVFSTYSCSSNVFSMYPDRSRFLTKSIALKSTPGWGSNKRLASPISSFSWNHKNTWARLILFNISTYVRQIF